MQRQYLIFRVQDYPLAIVLDSVAEIVREDRVAKFNTNGTESVVGYATVREEIMPLLNVGWHLFKMSSTEWPIWIIIEKQGKKIAMQVTDAKDLTTCDAKSVQGVDLSDQVIEFENDIVPVLDCSQFFDLVYGSNMASPSIQEQVPSAA